MTQGEQQALFEVGPNEEIGYRGPVACQVAGITYRQLDYWARTKLVVPSIRAARGHGTQRLYSFKDILVIKIVKGLLDAGISLQNIRVAVEKLRDLGMGDLATVTLVSDGRSVYACHNANEVFDLLSGAQGVFGIAVPGLVRELNGVISDFDGYEVSKLRPVDELAEMRAKRDARKKKTS
ncbi:MAG: MerR family transcriptional regulator [Corynebacterium sp.]|nr:MerR family transcriptional regulator [Corynebacterium sp.]